MPPIIRPGERWLGDQLSGLKDDTAALKAQQTSFVVDAAGDCQAIIGNLAFDHRGNATGLGQVWGIASHRTGSWVQL